MKTLKIKTSLQLMSIALLFASCSNLKQSNFNRQKFLHLKQQETSLSIKTDKVEEMNYQGNGSTIIQALNTTIEIVEVIPYNFNLVENESNLDNVSKKINVTSLIENSSKTIERDLTIENDIPKLNDTLFYKSGLAKPCAINGWEDGFVTCSYPVRGVMTERRISISTLNCFVVYDLQDNLEHKAENCNCSTQGQISSGEIVGGAAIVTMGVFATIASIIILAILVSILSAIACGISFG